MSVKDEDTSLFALAVLSQLSGKTGQSPGTVIF